MSSLRVRDVMTSELFVVEPDEPVALLHDLMNLKRIRHLPVVDADGELVGLVSERDVIRYTFAPDPDVSRPTRAVLLDSLQVGDIMTRDVETVEADDDLAVAARIMLENKFGCLPVFDEGVLAGIITEADFVRLVAGAPAEGTEAADVEGDEEEDEDELDEEEEGEGEFDSDEEDAEDEEDEDEDEDEEEQEEEVEGKIEVEVEDE